MGHPAAGWARPMLCRLPSSAKTWGLTPALLQATTASSKVLPVQVGMGVRAASSIDNWLEAGCGHQGGLCEDVCM